MELNKSHYLKGINFCIDQSNQALTIFRNFSKKKALKNQAFKQFVKITDTAVRRCSTKQMFLKEQKKKNTCTTVSY